MYFYFCFLLFVFELEIVYGVMLYVLDVVYCSELLCFVVKLLVDFLVDVFGLCFFNLVGFVVGLDKNVDYFDVFGVLGFGFVEVGIIML